MALELASTFPEKDRRMIKDVLALLKSVGGRINKRPPDLFNNRLEQLPTILSLALKEGDATLALQVFEAIHQEVELSAEVQLAICELDHIASVFDNLGQMEGAILLPTAYGPGVAADQLLCAWREQHLPKLKEQLPEPEPYGLCEVA